MLIKTFLQMLSFVLLTLSIGVNAASPYTAIVSIDGSQVVAKDSNGNIISSGVAGTDDATVVNYALSRSNSAVVYLAPATTFNFNQTITIAGTQGTGSQRLIGGGRESTIVNYTGSDPNVIFVDATNYFVLGAEISDISINANGKTAIYLKAQTPAAATKCAIKKLYIVNAKIGIKTECTPGNEIYKCSFRDISILNVGPNGYGIYAGAGCYNTFDSIEVGGVGDNSYAIFNGQTDSVFSSVSCDGCISEAGQGNTWIETTIETIFATNPPVTMGAFRLAGYSHTITSLEFTNVDPAKCNGTGIWVYGDDHLINGVRCWGTLSPTYPFVCNPPSIGRTCIAINIKGGASSSWAGINMSGWKFIGCQFKTENSGSSTGTGSIQAIAHGLLTTPNSINIVPTVAGATVSGTWADSTNIYANVTNGKSFKWSTAIK